MKLIKNHLFYNIFFLSLAACSQNPAEVEYRSNTNQVYHDKVQPLTSITEEKLPPIKEHGKIIVRQGETVHTIAVDHNVLVEDLVKINNLENPHHLEVGRTLILPSYKIYYVDNNETIQDIADKHKVDAELIVSLNKLVYPYTLSFAQPLRIPNNPENYSDPAHNTAIIQQNISNSNTTNLELPAKEIHKNKKNDNDLAFKFTNNKKVNIISSENSTFSWPIKGPIISKFGENINGVKNDGIRIKQNIGAEVKAAKAGKVYYVGNEIQNMHNLVIILHNKNEISAYANLDQIKVKKNQQVTNSTVIGTVGTAGNLSSPHVYFGIRKDGKSVDPLKFLIKNDQ